MALAGGDGGLACVGNDAPRARDALLAWSALAFTGEPPASLLALGERLGDPMLRAELERLDRALYAGDRDWTGTGLWLQAQRALVPPREPSRRARSSPLPPLYPRAG